MSLFGTLYLPVAVGYWGCSHELAERTDKVGCTLIPQPVSYFLHGERGVFQLSARLLHSSLLYV